MAHKVDIATNDVDRYTKHRFDNCNAPQQYKKKPVKIGQGLDFLNVGEQIEEDPRKTRRTTTSLAFQWFFDFFWRGIFDFGYFGTWIAEIWPQNLSPGRKFHAEFDFLVKTKKFWRPEAKNKEKPKMLVSEIQVSWAFSKPWRV